jgi:RNA polymerase sigma-70 factor (ECF subfamily)
MQTDEQLMLDFHGGSSAAFEELFTRYRNPVYGFFRRRLTNAARAEELAQETFLIMLRKVERYEPRARFKAYVFGIAVKQLWSERRRDARDLRTRTEAAQASADNGHAADPNAGLWIAGALEALDPAHREVLMLREYEELSYEDIAEVMAVPLNTVRSRLFRARSELRAALDPQRVPGD